VTTTRLARCAVPLVVAAVLAACSSAPLEPDVTPSTDAPATPPDTPSPSVGGDAAPTSSAAALLAATQDPLDASILPPGYHYEDSVEVDDGTAAVSNIYGGPDGPTGPTIWLYTDIGRDYATERHAGLTWTAEPAGTDEYTVRFAEGSDDFAFVDIDAPGTVDASIQLVARDVPVADLRQMADRLLASTDR
jgi:hypothetical protein